MNMKKEASKSVAKASDTSVSTEVLEPTLDEWGEQTDHSAKDLVISKIFPMQMSSKKVADEKAAFGEFRDSLSNALLGSISQPLEFIPIRVPKTWVESILQSDNTWKYVRTIPVTPENEELPYEEEVGGTKYKRVKTYNALVLLPGELETGLPKIVSFRSSSIQAGRKLSTQMYTLNKLAGLAPAAKVMKLVAAKQKNEKGVFVVLDVEVSRDATAKEQRKALEWFKTMKAQPAKFKEDHSEDGELATEEVPTVDGKPKDF